MLLKIYYKRRLANPTGDKTDWSLRLLRILIAWQGAKSQQKLTAIDYHCSNYPAKDGTGFLGYFDSIKRIDADFVELRGWLVHTEARIVALTFFGSDRAIMADYGFPRVDLVPLLTHLPQVDLSGFRIILPAAIIVSGTRITFQAFLADKATRFGSFAIDKQPEDLERSS